MSRLCQFLSVSLLVVGFAGCAGRDLGWFPPGPIRQQQFRASLHDPYPDNDAAPEAVGTRPRDFQKPLAEPVRNSLIRDRWLGR